MGPTGRIQIELEGAAPGSGYDQLNASADLILNGNGTLDVTASVYAPVQGARHAVLTYNDRQGDFAVVNLPSGFDTLSTTHGTGANTPDTLYVVATTGGPAPPNLNRWTGAVDTDWGTAGNWSKGAVPVAGDSVVIDAQGVPNVVLGASTTIAHLDIGASGSFPTLSLFGAGHTLTVTGTVTNSGIISFQDNVTGGAPMTLSVGGVVTVTPLGIIVAQGSTEVPQLSGQLLNQGTIWTQSQGLQILPVAAQHLNLGLFMASGGDIQVELSGSNFFFNSGVMQMDAGRTISFQNGTLTNQDGGTITGGGTLQLGGTGFVQDGFIYPGVGATNSILTIDGSSTFASSSTLLFDLGGATPGAHDQLIHTGTTALDGTLLVTVTAFQPQDGDRFAVMTFAGRTGNFADVQFPFVPGIVLDTVWAEGGTVDTLYIAATASPTIPLNAIIGAPGANADDVDGPGNPVNLVGTAVNGGTTTLSVGANPITADFNDLLGNGVDRTIGFSRSDLLAVLANRHFYYNTDLVLDLNNNGSFLDESPQIGFSMHAARFVTFDLDQIRLQWDLDVDQAFTLSGYAGPADYVPTDGMSLVVLVDGNPYVHDVTQGAVTSIQFVIPIGGSDRYITFAALEGPGLNEFGDHGGFAQVLLTY
jgi:hypothetical protein